MNSNYHFDAVFKLNLEAIKTKLMHVESGEGWSLEKAAAVEKEYKCFLFLMKMYPNEETVPTVDVDTFWHYHILDTVKYAADCAQAFGYFLHHNPYVGFGGEEEEQMRHESIDRTRTLYEQTFGEEFISAARQAGYCGATGVKLTYCGSNGLTAAYCGATGMKAAYCGGSRINAAYCGATGMKAAYCGGSRINAAYCGATGMKSPNCEPIVNSVRSEASNQAEAPALAAAA